MTTSRKTESLQLFKESLLSTGNLGLEDQVEAVQFLEKRLEESRKLAREKCEELKKALNTEAKSDGEPPVKKPRFDTSNEIDEENGNILPRNVNNLPVEKDTPEHNRRTEEVSEGSRSTSDADEQLKRDLEDALNYVKTKEVEAEQLRKAVAVKDAEMKTKENQLTVSLNIMSAEKKQLEEKLAGQTKALEGVKHQTNVVQQEYRKKSAELQEKVKELNAANTQARSARNAHSNMARQINALEKSRNTLRHENLTNISKHKMEIARMKKESEESKAVGDDIVNLRNHLECWKKNFEEVLKTIQFKDAEAEQLKRAADEKDAELAKSRSTVIQLKKIGRDFREKAEAAEKAVNDLTVEREKMEVKFNEAQGLLEAEQIRREDFEAQVDDLKREKGEHSKNFGTNESCAKKGLESARAKMITIKEEKKQQELTAAKGGLGEPVMSVGSAQNQPVCTEVPNTLVEATLQPPVSIELDEAQLIVKVHQIPLNNLELKELSVKSD